MKLSLSLFSLLALALQGVKATFNCSMNVDVNSRDCPEISCGITGQYLAGQVVVFDCVESSGGNFKPINGSVWWARDPLKNFVPVGNMMGVDGNSCDTNLGLCASLPSTTSSAAAPSTTSAPTSTDTTKNGTSLSASASGSSGLSASNNVASSGTSSVLSNSSPPTSVSSSSTNTSSPSSASDPSSSAPSGTSSAIRLRLGHGTFLIPLLAIVARLL
ncbi:hypothetical protein B0H13DRAFT_2035031, partial [Mycena leptocephala]